MKYIVTKDENGVEDIFVFPSRINHFGNSETLGLTSRPEDTKLFRNQK